MIKCDVVKEKLGAWMDGELGGIEANQIKTHLAECVSCAAEQQRAQKVDASLKRILELEAAAVPFASFWAGVEHKISGRIPWHVGFADWLQGALYPRRLAWAIPLVIMSLLGVLSLNRLLPEWSPLNGSARTAVESIDAFGLNVAVFREHDTKTMVIWLFDDEEQSSAEPIPDSPTF